jgi:hypothetical protein
MLWRMMRREGERPMQRLAFLLLLLTATACNPAAPQQQTPDLQERTCLTGPVNITGSLDGIGREISGNDAGPSASIAVLVATSSQPVAQSLIIPLTAEQEAQLRDPKLPALVKASGTYHATCSSFFNDGWACLDKGACVILQY